MIPRSAFYVRSSFQISHQHGFPIPTRLPIVQFPNRHQRQSSRHFSITARFSRQQDGSETFSTKLRRAWGETKIRWYSIPAGLGIGFLAVVQFYKVNEREKAKRQDSEDDDGFLRSSDRGEERDIEDYPKRRKRIRPTGPWFVWLTVQSLIAL